VLSLFERCQVRRTNKDQSLSFSRLIHGLLSSSESLLGGLDDILLDSLASGMFQIGDLLVQLSFGMVEYRQTR
jgi:hypothetical protein